MLLRVNTLIKKSPTTAPDIDPSDVAALIDLSDDWGCHAGDWERCRIGGTDPIKYERGARLFMETT